MDLFSLSLMFFTIYLIGRFLERIGLPWIFGALILGLALSYLHYPVNGDQTFEFLSNLGLYFMLFVIGFEININQFKKQGALILKSTLLLILGEALVGTLLIHFLFNTPWLISLVIGLSFATIGEAVLLPILERLKLVKTNFGQLALDISVVDDLFEVISILGMSVLLTYDLGYSTSGIIYSLTLLFGLFILFSVVIPAIRKRERFQMGTNFSEFFLLSLAIFFLFVSASGSMDLAPLGAILSGIVLKNFVSRRTLELFENEIKTLAYGFFGPIFFFSVGYATDVYALLSNPLLIVGISAVVMFIKSGIAYLTTRSKLGDKSSILLGLCLSVKFSTGIVVTKYFLDMGLITQELFSILIGVNLWFSFVQPFIIGWFARKIKN